MNGGSTRYLSRLDICVLGMRPALVSCFGDEDDPLCRLGQAAHIGFELMG